MQAAHPVRGERRPRQIETSRVQHLQIGRAELSWKRSGFNTPSLPFLISLLWNKGTYLWTFRIQSILTFQLMPLNCTVMLNFPVKENIGITHWVRDTLSVAAHPSVNCLMIMKAASSPIRSACEIWSSVFNISCRVARTAPVCDGLFLVFPWLPSASSSSLSLGVLGGVVVFSWFQHLAHFFQ